jgi:hypothetical protein
MMRLRALVITVVVELVLLPGRGSAQSVAPGSAAPSSSSPPSPSPEPSPSQDAVKDAEAHFHRNVDLYKDSDYGGALVEFQRAYDLAPNYRVLFNLGQTQRGGPPRHLHRGVPAAAHAPSAAAPAWREPGARWARPRPLKGGGTRAGQVLIHRVR